MGLGDLRERDGDLAARRPRPAPGRIRSRAACRGSGGARPAAGASRSRPRSRARARSPSRAPAGGRGRATTPRADRRPGSRRAASSWLPISRETLAQCSIGTRPSPSGVSIVTRSSQGGAAAREQRVDQLEARALDDRFDQHPELLRNVPIHDKPWPTNKKSGLDAHFRHRDPSVPSTHCAREELRSPRSRRGHPPPAAGDGGWRNRRFTA